MKAQPVLPQRNGDKDVRQCEYVNYGKVQPVVNGRVGGTEMRESEEEEDYHHYQSR